jgi:phosphatidate phosphatase PAH1
MSKNNVKGALDDWGFDSTKASVQKEIKPVSTQVGKSESQEPVKSENKQTGRFANKILTTKPIPTKVGKLDVQILGKKESQEVGNKIIDQNIEDKIDVIEKVILKSKTFDLPPNLIRRIKMEAASSDKKEYQIALEAFEQYFQETF